MRYMQRMLRSQRTAVAQRAEGGEGLEKAHILRVEAIGCKRIGLQTQMETFALVEKKPHGGVAYHSLAKIVIAIKGIGCVIVLHASRVEGGIPPLVDPYPCAAVIKEEHLLPQHRVGRFLMKNEAFGGGGIGISPRG